MEIISLFPLGRIFSLIYFTNNLIINLLFFLPFLEKNKMSNDDEDNNCVVGSTCSNDIRCSVNGNCYYDIIALYKNDTPLYPEIFTECICNAGYGTLKDNKIKCCYAKKSQFTAFILELVVGFGSSHFYLGRYIFACGKLLLTLLGYIICCVSLIIICSEKKKIEEEKKKCNTLYILVIGSICALFLIAILDLFLLGFGVYKDGKGMELKGW